MMTKPANFKVILKTVIAQLIFILRSFPFFGITGNQTLKGESRTHLQKGKQHCTAQQELKTFFRAY